MSAKQDGGGAASPTRTYERWVNGMTLRQYFIAHAPAEPQTWFKPVIATEFPMTPPFPYHPDEDPEAREVWEFQDTIKPADIKSPELRTWVEQKRAMRPQQVAWMAERDKQHYVQWPAAWADEMIKAARA